ncbi:MAG: hypothetical protein IBX50_13225, partial [Marinospirillum sp.]|nr:hypothetical protein [Marinospirillum sp.]
MSNEKKVRVLFVCLGNICRSPTAEGIFTHLVNTAGLQDQIETDSAGTSDAHAGEAPDDRMLSYNPSAITEVPDPYYGGD